MPRDNRRQQPKRAAKVEGEAVAHNGFGVTIGFDGALVRPAPHGEHRRFFMKSATRPQLGDHQVVVVEREHAEQPPPAPA
jgi:hypothetical protein